MRVVPTGIVVIEVHGGGMVEGDARNLDPAVVLGALVRVAVEVGHCDDVSSVVHLGHCPARPAVRMIRTASSRKVMLHLLGKLVQVDSSLQAVLVGADLSLIHAAHRHSWRVFSLNHNVMTIHEAHRGCHQPLGLLSAQVNMIRAPVAVLQRLGEADLNHAFIERLHRRDPTCLEASVDDHGVAYAKVALLELHTCSTSSNAGGDPGPDLASLLAPEGESTLHGNELALHPLCGARNMWTKALQLRGHGLAPQDDVCVALDKRMFLRPRLEAAEEGPHHDVSRRKPAAPGPVLEPEHAADVQLINEVHVLVEGDLPIRLDGHVSHALAQVRRQQGWLPAKV
mmetsp:Transcript_53238/g.134518  ORF Transcript_53238/g.134518 Transcript_53238/m.134518 type:complete len:341 (+) Transcript_53238:3495-4517(+)